MEKTKKKKEEFYFGGLVTSYQILWNGVFRCGLSHLSILGVRSVHNFGKWMYYNK